MKSTKIISAQIITPYRIIRDGELCFTGGRIDYVGPRRACGEPGGYELIDAGGCYVSPGFIDIHTHGGGGHDFMDGTEEAILSAAACHSRHGTTTLVPTTLSGDIDETLNFLRVFSSVHEKSRVNLPGVHLEGPYFSMNQKGAQDPKYIKPPARDEYMKILGSTDSIIRWSFAPELEGSAEFIIELKNRGVLPSIGHSDGTYDDVASAFENGANHITHLFSCMSTISRKNGYRSSGVLESAMMLDEMTVELIADGRHVPAELLNMVYRQKGADKIALVTDSMRAAGTNGGESILGSLKNGQKVIIEDDVAKLTDRSAFAGSVATMDRLVRVMAKEASVPLCDAVRMAASTPARILGLKNKGILTPGNDADILFFDDNIDIKRTIINGETIYQKEVNSYANCSNIRQA